MRLLEGDAATIASLSRHLRNALKVGDETVQGLLWRPPRALLLEAVPTLARRLHRDWRKAHATGDRDLDLQVDWHPLPDYVARTLFTDLNLPEVAVILPPATVRDIEKQRPMAIAPALTELAPGRVTRRFAFEHGGLHHWLPVNPDGGDQDISIASYAEASEFVGTSEADGRPVSVYRPWRIRLQRVSKHVAGPTSNAWLDWRSGFVEHGEPTAIELGARDPWREPIPRLSAFLHRHRSHVTLRRFAPGGDAVIRRLTGDRRIRYRFVNDDGSQAGIGSYGRLLSDLLDFSGQGAGVRTAYWLMELVEETFAANTPDQQSRERFWQGVVSRLAPILPRLSALQRSSLSQLADMLGWGDVLPDGLAGRGGVNEDPTLAGRLAGKMIAIYTLTGSAGAQAANALLAIAPDVDIRVNSDFGGSRPLRALAENADLFVVVAASATHAATDFIRAKRGSKPLTYAAGRGAVSIVRAVEEWLFCSDGRQDGAAA